MKHVVILGAGISGLAAGWFLHQRWQSQIQLTLVETSERVGGWIHTLDKEGFLFEQGPRGFRSEGKGAYTLSLSKELGLEKSLIAANHMAKRRYLSIKGRLRPLSLSLLLQYGFLRACFRDWKTPPSPLEDETIQSFCDRRFPRSVTETFFDAFIKGVYAGDMTSLSCRSCLPTLWKWEKQYGSVLKGWLASRKAKTKRGGLYSFLEGMEILPKTLAAKLPADIFLHTPVKRIETVGEKLVVHAGDKTIHADRVISALPACELARLLPQAHSYLDALSFATLSIVSLGWRGKQLSKRGYGFLVPSKEKQGILGMVWDSEIFPEQNREAQTRIAVMIDGSPTNEELVAIARLSSAHYLQLSKPPDVTALRVARSAIAHYTVGHQERLKKLEASLPKGMHLLGSNFYGVGVNDCIVAAKTLAQNLSF